MAVMPAPCLVSVCRVGRKPERGHVLNARGDLEGHALVGGEAWVGGRSKAG